MNADKLALKLRDYPDAEIRSATIVIHTGTELKIITVTPDDVYKSITETV